VLKEDKMQLSADEYLKGVYREWEALTKEILITLTVIFSDLTGEIFLIA
jgi:hypothetical protein